MLIIHCKIVFWNVTPFRLAGVYRRCGKIASYKAALGQVFSEYFGFPCQSFHRFLHHHNHTGLAQQTIGGRSVEWTLIPPPTIQIKKKLHFEGRRVSCLHLKGGRGSLLLDLANGDGPSVNMHLATRHHNPAGNDLCNFLYELQ
jgi:hypothetical protein